MNELKNEVISYIPKLITGIREVVDCFNQGNIDNALKNLNGIINGLDWTITAINQLMFDHLQYITEFNGYINEINTSLSSKDYILAADIFEYEIIGLLEKVRLKLININSN